MKPAVHTAFASFARKHRGTARLVLTPSRVATLAVLVVAAVAFLALNPAGRAAVSTVVSLAGGVVLAAALPLVALHFVVSGLEA